MPIVYLSRRSTFCASHRLHSEELSATENKKLFGKCNSLNGHGHNYVFEVILRGKINPKTGILINLVKLKDAIERSVITKVDHQHLNLDISEFKKLNPTVENMAVVFWNWLSKELPPGLLFEVRLHETENNIAIYRGEYSS